MIAIPLGFLDRTVSATSVFSGVVDRPGTERTVVERARGRAIARVEDLLELVKMVAERVKEIMLRQSWTMSKFFSNAARTFGVVTAVSAACTCAMPREQRL